MILKSGSLVTVFSIGIASYSQTSKDLAPSTPFLPLRFTRIDTVFYICRLALVRFGSTAEPAALEAATGDVAPAARPDDACRAIECRRV